MGPHPDLNFHLRMAGLLVGALFLEHLAATHLPAWSSPRIQLLPFVLGLLWVALFAHQHLQLQRQRLARLEQELRELQERTERLEADRRERRSLPPW
jgi:hypothetical protein